MSAPVLALLLVANPALAPSTPAEPNPWQVGPAPSAEAVSPSWSLGAELGALWVNNDARSTWVPGLRATAAFAPHPRIWTSLELGVSQGWRTCLDCRAFAGTWTARGLVVNHPNVHVAAWSVLTGYNGTFQWTPGVAVEAGGEHVRVDTSWMVWSTVDMIEVLRGTPELGIAYRWGRRHSTRAALVGLEPAFALQHRVRIRDFVFVATARVGEEGLAFELGIRGYAGVPWSDRLRRRERRRRRRKE